MFSGMVYNNFAQTADGTYYDTLYYEGGLIKPCSIKKVENKRVYFVATTKKGLIYSSSVSTKNLEYYVDYDSTGMLLLSKDQLLLAEKDPTKYEYRMIIDTVEVPHYHFSVNPIALGLLGLDMDLISRFKNRPLWAIHFPFRLHTYFGKTLIFHTGLGINYMAYNSSKVNLYFGADTQFYFFNAESGLGFPLRMGLITNLSKKVTLHISGGAGPIIGTYAKFSGNIATDFHFGLGFNFGDRYTITSTNKKKVWKE